MKTKAKSVQVFEIRLWSKRHYQGSNYKASRKDKTNIYDGFITDAKSKQKIFVDSAGDLLKAIELLYAKAEKKAGTGNGK